jgi:hypothetical protein
MRLYVNGRTFVIGQLGPDFVILDDAADIPRTGAEIALSIDGRLRRWRVELPEGITVAKSRTPTAPGRS